jgi:hypothetical protein
MARTEHDSALSLGWGSLPEGMGAAPPPDVPMLDLAGSGPLPADLPEAPRASSTAGRRWQDEPAAIWLDGDVLMCACPDCRAPMTIRLWLMAADCWQCGTSIELTRQQQREAERLLRERAEAAAASAVRPPPAPVERQAEPAAARREAPQAEPPVVDAPAAAESAPQPSGRRRAPAATPMQAKLRQLSQFGSARVWLSEFFRDMPAWLISLILHVVALTLLGLFYLETPKDEPDILLSLAPAFERREGGDTEQVDPREIVKFDIPIPEKDQPKNEEQRRAMILADQEARELRLNPEARPPQLPELARVREAVASMGDPTRTFAARDPRLRVEVVTREGGTTLTEAAVARGLRWMSKHQNADGSWSLNAFHRGGDCNGRCGGGGSLRSDPAGTALVLLPFLGAGQTHETGIYKDVVAKGLRWLVEQQAADGDLRGNSQGNAGMYAHGQAAIVLCEAYSMTGDEYFREPAQKSIDFIVKAQHPAGGWRYSPGEAGDTSVVGWQLMALQSARAARLNVPQETLELAGQFLDSVASRDGSLYAYQKGRAPTHVMTAEALLCRMYLGWTTRDSGLVRGVDYLVRDYLPSRNEHNLYYWYYATQVMHHVGGPQWDKWNGHMRDILVQTQEREGHPAGSSHDGNGGRLYATALATCTLEVYYRHAPIFRQLDLSENRP